jgi:hypothetical protein
VGKKYVSKGYPHGTAAHMGSISMWIYIYMKCDIKNLFLVPLGTFLILGKRIVI